MLREFPRKGGRRNIMEQLVEKATGHWVGRQSSQQWQTTPHPAQLITMIFFTNWGYTKMATREIIFAHCT